MSAGGARGPGGLGERGLGARVGWLLRAWREDGPDQGLRVQCRLADRLRQLDPQMRIDAPRLSRFETGHSQVTTRVLAAMEEAFGLSAGLLVATVEGLYREHQDPLTRPPYHPATWARQVDEAVSAIQRDRHTGATWYLLAGLVEGAGTMVYLPPALRADLADRLVEEIPRSVGLAYVQRIEALCRLLPTRALRDELMIAIGEVVVRPHSQAVTDVVANLHHAGGERPLRLLLRLARHERPVVCGAALWSLEHLAERGLLPVGLHDDARAAAVVALRGGQPETVDHATRLFAHLAPDQRHGRRPVGRGTTPPEQDPRPEAARIEAAQACAGLGVEHDRVLQEIVADALGAGGPNLALESGLLLMASPWRSRVATMALERAAATPARASLETSTDWLRLLAHVVTAEQLPAVVDLVRGSAGHGLVDPALRVLAHVPVPPAEIAGLWDGRVDSGDRVSTAHMYALGMTGHPSLTAVASDETRPAEVRGAAAWWLAGPVAIHA